MGEYWPAEAVAIEAYDEDGTNHSQFPITLAVNHPYRVIAGPSPFNATVGFLFGRLQMNTVMEQIVTVIN